MATHIHRIIGALMESVSHLNNSTACLGCVSHAHDKASRHKMLPPLYSHSRMAQGFLLLLDTAFSSLRHTDTKFTLPLFPLVGEKDVQCTHGVYGRARRKGYLQVLLRALHVGA